MEELALPTRAIQLSGKGLNTDEAASAELHEAEVRTRLTACAAYLKPCP